MTETQTLVVTQTIKAPLGQVYQAFNSSVALQSWLSDFAEATAREDGRFYVWWNVGYYASGLFKKVEEDKHLTFTWFGLGEPEQTKVDVTFGEQDGGTLVTIKHSEVGSGEAWDDTIKGLTNGWEGALANLKSILESGLDKRIYDRPMLGVLPNEMIDAERAEELGLPVTTGARISDVVAGQGAEAAGLQAGDVIYILNERELKVFADFALAMHGKKAGDTVEVVFYRGSEKHTADMKLSGRPVPRMFASANDLADHIADLYNQQMSEMEGLFDEASEEEASARPGEKEWSARETVAHLIFSEHWLQLAMTASIGNYRAGGYSNDLGMYAAIANSFPTYEGLLAEFKRAQGVTVAAARALPDDFVADKRRFTGLSTTIAEQGLVLHTRSHFAQIKEALEAAKKK